MVHDLQPPQEPTRMTSLPREDEPSSGAVLSIDQWTALVAGVVVIFIGVTLVVGLQVGRVLRPEPVMPASTGMMLPSASAKTLLRPDQPVPPIVRDIEPVEQDIRLLSVVSGAPGLGDPAPDFTLQTLSGETLTLSELQGRPVLLNFWATWSYWCRFEMPALQAAYQKYHLQGLAVVAVNVQEPRSLVKGYTRRYGLTFPIVLDVDGGVSTRYRVRGLPMTYILHADGTIARIQRGAMREDELERHILRVLGR